MPLGKLAAFCLVFLTSIAGCTAVNAQGTVTVPLSNVSTTCLNASTRVVDFWILSARVPKDQNWITTTHGVGARVDVTITGPGEKVSFPAAAAINTRDISGQVVRASLALHVLAGQDLWNMTNPAAPVKTNDLSVPVSFVRRQGSSNAAKLMQALISFTQSSTSAIPPNPYVKGAELVGQLTSSLLTVFQPDPKDVVDPNFSLSFSVGRVDSNCAAKDLHEGVGVEISDAKSGAEADGIIKTANLSQYCFYKLGMDSDPDIGFATKSGQSCAADIPANVKTLNNPQFIWMANGTCKTDAGCNAAPVPHVANGIGAAALNINHVQDLLRDRIGDEASDSTVQILKTPNGDFKVDQSKQKTVLNSLSLCKSVGINAERCLSKKLVD